jgi:hypothetical protein
MTNFAAPELFDVDEDNDMETTRLTKQTDVYAFGCLYYAVCLDYF